MNLLNPVIKTADLITIGCKLNSEEKTNIIDSESYNYSTESYNVFAFSGLVYSVDNQPKLYNFSDCSLPAVSKDLDNLKGQWAAVLTNEKRSIFKIVADYFGFQSVFYRYDIIDEGHSQLSVSTSYNSLIEYSKNNLLPYNFNEEQFYLAMGATNVHLRTAFSSESFCREIKLLGVDETLSFDTLKDIFKVDKKEFIRDPKGRSYEELISIGVNKAKKDIASLVKFYEDKRIFLSGGRDSRMVLALLSSLGIEKDFTTAMGNPQNLSGLAKRVVEKDLYVSTYLANEFGMKHSEFSEHLRLNLDFEKSLERILSYGAQFAWTIAPSNRVTLPTHSYLALRGGGGELFRAHDTSREAIAELQTKYPNFNTLDFDTQVDALFNLYINVKTIPNNYIVRCKELFTESFVFDKEFSLEQNIDWHFDYYRNRVHFGHYISSFSKNELAFHPLMQKEFLYAANHYNIDERRGGKICYDIIEKLNPELNKITFDNGHWSDIDTTFGPTLEELSKDTELYKEYYEVQVKNSALAHRPVDINKYEIDSEQNLSRYKIYNLAINSLLELVYERKYTLNHIEQIIKNIHSGKASPVEVFLKYIDYKNIFEEYNTSCNLLSVNVPFSRKYLDYCNLESQEKLLSTKKECFKNLDYTFVVSESLSFKVNLSSKFDELFDKVEYAFYLHENGKILDKCWYGEKSEYHYNNLDKGKRYVVHFFLKIFIEDKAFNPIIVRSDFIDT
ncbi:hypothetical protein [Psychrobacter sp. Cmf 22.2]|uniref:hypothetical protein n=1 Tax=Psychrobacter sp. Cmf 22.2 TaxID=1926478 RepID=UPI000946BBE9|nr:hypothetical protein [Psychrobacter sp. Cmf 22.2]OLF37505.1 hypothetical protein BTV98_07765 [Psychrobacter sp. Cmf 22.2]